MKMSAEAKRFIQDNPEWKSAPDLLLAPPSGQEIMDAHPDAGGEIIQRSHEPMGKGYTRGAFYMLLRVRGTSANMAEMLALQKCAGLDTDDVFFSGSKPLYDQFESQKHLDRYLKVAKARGFTPNAHSTYFPGLARFSGDPEAFVTRAQGRSYIRELCEKRGWACEGGVNVEGRQPEDDPLDNKNCVPLAESIIKEKTAAALRKNPGMSKRKRSELRDKIIEKHGKR